MVQVQYKSSFQTWFVREDGRTFPASRRYIAGRFGESFTLTAETWAGEWVEFDPSCDEPPTLAVSGQERILREYAQSMRQAEVINNVLARAFGGV